METYFAFAVFSFIGTLIYQLYTSSGTNEKDSNLITKIGISLIAALIFPILIIGGLLIFGIGVLGHGG